MTQTTKGAQKNLFEAAAVKELFENIGAPADKIDNFMEIFEAAVLSSVDAQLAEATEHLEAEYSEKIDQLEEKAEEYVKLVLENKEGTIEEYIDYFAEEFVKNNQLVIESNIKASMFDQFVGDIKSVVESFSVPLNDDNIDIVESLESKLNEKSLSLNEATRQIMELRAQLDEGRKAEVIESLTEGLTQTQLERVKILAEGLTLNESFEGKVKQFVSAVSGKPQATDDNLFENQNQTPKRSGSLMESYLSAAKSGSTLTN